MRGHAAWQPLNDSHEVDVHDPAPQLGRHVPGIRRRADARIVDQHVDPAVAAPCGVEHRFECRAVAYVERDRLRRRGRRTQAIGRSRACRPSRSDSTTRAPASAAPLASPRPMPEAAPVMNTDLPTK
jgi:hypothetical protein